MESATAAAAATTPTPKSRTGKKTLSVPGESDAVRRGSPPAATSATKAGRPTRATGRKSGVESATTTTTTTTTTPRVVSAAKARKPAVVVERFDPTRVKGVGVIESLEGPQERGAGVFYEDVADALDDSDEVSICGVSVS